MAAKTNFVIKSVVKQTISKAKLRSSGDVFDGLNMLVQWYIGEACKRAKANGRQTVRGHDFCADSK